MNTSLSATVTACWCSTWLQKHPTGPRSYSSFRFQVLGAEQPLPVSTCSYFEVKVLHNPDTRGGLALGVCGHLPSGTETHSIRPLLWWEEEKGKNWRVVLVFVFAGGDICRLIIVLHTAYIYIYLCRSGTSSHIYWANVDWNGLFSLHIQQYLLSRHVLALGPPFFAICFMTDGDIHMISIKDEWKECIEWPPELKMRLSGWGFNGRVGPLTRFFVGPKNAKVRVVF